ncbi:MAG: amidase [Sandaracinaceae bacterium]
MTPEEARVVLAARNPALRAVLRPIAEDGGPGPLSGVPYTLKDVWRVAGAPTTYGSASPAADEPHSGPVHAAFRDAGAVLVGKTNLSDRGLTPECRSLVGGVTVHPEDATRTPGGSSGGAAVAVATGMSAFDWGSDFGGSIRLPAAFCGVYGMRLSHRAYPPPSGFVSGPPLLEELMGMGPIAANLDMLRRVLDVARPLLGSAVGSAVGSAPALPAFRGLLMLAPDRFSRGHWAGFENTATAALRRAGLDVAPAPLPPPRIWDDAFVALIASHRHHLVHPPVTATDVLSSLAGRSRALHPDSARVLFELALLATLHDRERALQEAIRLRARVDALFDSGFLLVTPTSTFPAPRHGTALRTKGLASFVKLGNLADATALSVPYGRFAEGLPRGLQLLGPPGSEARLMDLAERLTA